MPEPPTILYAEDHPLLRLNIAETLTDAGWKVEACADGLAALSRIEGDESFDLLLLDDEMPGVSGIELVRRARELPHRRATPVVVLSGGDREREARRAGADVFLKKPEGFGVLVLFVGRLLARGRA